MPELPEAETIARTLRPRLLGRRIVEARFLSKRVSDDEPSELQGKTVRDVRRYGKRVLIELDAGMLVVDLRMTGKLLLNLRPGPYTRAVFRLDRGTLLFDDVRQFGSVRMADCVPQGLGPDPLEVSAAEFSERLHRKNTDVKRALLDQTFVRGVGNIYADEALYRARIHPRSRTQKLSRARAARLHGAVQKVLREAIAAGGSSVSDYVDADGRQGWFQVRHMVYQKQGEPCSRCGRAIERIVVGQRGTHFCPKCQR